LAEPARVAYADASALAKLVLAETETDALLGRIRGHDRLLTSIVGVVELVRVSRRELGERGAREASGVVAGLTVVPLTPEVADLARSLDPPGLRALEAIHLASARVGALIVDAFYCYDHRLCEAAAGAGLPVESPGA
jgi:predicted nucleic acid-binding protein